ncbi:10087_t:CDS:2 [Racocetra fulgida]|uniref:10087_t:CDS:1 n=1 Tax=Racocetra fulgida TaxID=60492 RepID=A0A9N8ZIB5_9GLOM|nr:10087_t:CDS:2 [Racocetra fulgida]
MYNTCQIKSFTVSNTRLPEILSSNHQDHPGIHSDLFEIASTSLHLPDTIDDQNSSKRDHSLYLPDKINLDIVDVVDQNLSNQ